MTIVIRYFDRKENDFSGFGYNYDNQHRVSFHGQTARECMKQIEDYRMNHDIAKYTATEIYDVIDD